MHIPDELEIQFARLGYEIEVEKKGSRYVATAVVMRLASEASPAVIIDGSDDNGPTASGDSLHEACEAVLVMLHGDAANARRKVPRRS